MAVYSHHDGSYLGWANNKQEEIELRREDNERYRDMARELDH